MELMTKELEQTLPKLYETEDIKTNNKILRVKYIAVNSSWEWYLVEYNKDTKIAFGYVIGHEKEWGYFSLKEFQELNKDGLSIIRDKTFQPIEFMELNNNFHKLKI